MSSASPLIFLAIPLAALAGLAALRVILWTFRKFPQHFSPREELRDNDFVILDDSYQALVGEEYEAIAAEAIHGLEQLERRQTGIFSLEKQLSGSKKQSFIYRTTQGDLLIRNKKEEQKSAPMQSSSS